MRSPRGILAILILATLLSTGGALAMVAFWPRLPRPEMANRDQLLRWLVLRDLAEEPLETRRCLALRLEEEFGKGVEWDQLAGELDADQKQRVWENVVLMLPPWLDAKEADYFAASPPQRTAQIDKLLDTIEVWRGIDALRKAPAGTPAGGHSSDLLGTLGEEIQKWQQGADLQRRKRIDQFVLAVQMRWLLRSLSPATAGSP